MFITAMLTVVGYSMHNTIVVFDRIRENFGRGISKDFAVTVNASILETIARCVNTSLTVALVVLAIYLFGGATTQRVHAGHAAGRDCRHLQLHLHRRPAAGPLGQGPG